MTIYGKLLTELAALTFCEYSWHSSRNNLADNEFYYDDTTYMHTCLFVSVCVHVRLFVYMHVCMYFCMYILTHACTSVCMYAGMCMYACMYACSYVRTYVRSYVCMYTDFRRVVSPAIRSVFWHSSCCVKRTCWETGSWRCCPSRQVVNSIPRCLR